MNILRMSTEKPEAIIFFNPMGADKRFWEAMISQELYDHFEIILFDYPGFHSNFIYQSTLSETAEMVHVNLLSQINKPIHFCGYSYGGMIVQQLLKNNYENLQSVILIATQNKLTNYDTELIKLLSRLLEINAILFCRMLSILLYDPSFINNNDLFYLKLFSSIKLSTSTLQPISQQLNQMGKVTKINFPVLDIPVVYIYGEYDRMLKINTTDEIKKLLPNIKIKKIPDSYHILNGQILFTEITKFLKNKL